MKDLIDRLKKATGPDRELDIEIALASTKIDNEAEIRAALLAGWRPAGDTWPMRFTESIDAALTLVPDGYRWLVGNAWKDKHGSCPAMASVILAGDYGGRPTTAATPAIALCIAALEVRALSAGKSPE